MRMVRLALVAAALGLSLGSASRPKSQPYQQPYQQPQQQPYQQGGVSGGGFDHGGGGQQQANIAPAGGMSPQAGPWYCHHVTTQTGGQVWLCSRTLDACNQWSSKNAQNGFKTEPCQQANQASCYTQDGTELCTGSLDDCNLFRQSTEGGTPSACQTIYSQ
jgi:hypothetical protein